MNERDCLRSLRISFASSERVVKGSDTLWKIDRFRGIDTPSKLLTISRESKFRKFESGITYQESGMMSAVQVLHAHCSKRRSADHVGN